tara:strand:- start:22 stop:339 length:318 start_codon:yes stop_codon:yes gene_type:complete
MKLTINEVQALDDLCDGHDGEDLTSPYGSQNEPECIGPAGWNMQQRGALIASLIKKGLAQHNEGEEYSLGCDIITITKKGLQVLRFVKIFGLEIASFDKLNQPTN